MDILELYCGIGGCAAALSGGEAGARVVAALDINTRAVAVYRHNFPAHRAASRNLESLAAAELAGFGADLWWLSPPCQPFTHRGSGGDADDPRAQSFLHLIDRIADVRPPALALENVPGFEGSRVHGRLREGLDRAGYRVREALLCPTDLGVPNRRRRYYLVASLGREPGPWGHGGSERLHPIRIRDLVDRTLDADTPPELAVDADLPRRYPHALHVVDADDPDAVTACFTAAYGRSPVRSGSYLRRPDGHLRRFSPHEILRILGFPSGYSLPPDLSAAKAWPLVGNSLSIPAVRSVLRSLGVRS